MLVIPVERQLDWRKPPLITLAIILANIFIFFGYQSQDAGWAQKAVDEYLRDGLVEIEAPAYVEYLERQIHLQRDDRVELVDEVKFAIEENEVEVLAYIILFDQGFYNMLLKDGPLFWQDDVYEEWKVQRTDIVDNYVNKISTRELGLIPANIQVADLISYQFLHGGFGHLLGNMVFLFLLGFTVERALGKSKFLIAYLLCGVCSGLFFALFDLDSPLPLVGASGSISGLMGMYVAIFGLQKIRFFYSVGFYFDYFTAPALAILPVWIGKEIYDFWLGEASQVAYLAHAGGLIAGAAMVWGLGKSWMHVEDEFYEPDEDEQDEAFRKAYSQALSSVGRMEFAQAKKQFAELYQQYPDNIGMLEHLYSLEKLDPAAPDYHKHAKQLINESLKKSYFSLMLDTYKDYGKQSGESCQLEANDHNRVLYACLKNDDIKEAEKAFEKLRSHSSVSVEVCKEACNVMSEAFRKRQQTMKVNHYQKLLQQLDG